jgi:hypothetical protein
LGKEIDRILKGFPDLSKADLSKARKILVDAGINDWVKGQ